MDIISGRSITVSGMYLVNQAKKVARQILRRKIRSKISSVDGFLLIAKASGSKASGLVMDLPGALALLAPEEVTGELATYQVGTRDVFDSRSGRTDGPFTETSAKLLPSVLRYMALGFDGTPPAGALGEVRNIYSRSWLSGYRAVHSEKKHILVGVTSLSVPDVGSSVHGLAQPGAVSFAAIHMLDSAHSMGYVLSSEYLETICPGYVFVRSSTQGYVGSEYQTMSPAALCMGTLTVAAIPVTKQFGLGAEHWGEAGVLFVGLDYAAARAEYPDLSFDDLAVKCVQWHHLWKATDHPKAALRPGPWLGQPDWEPPFFNRGWYDFFTSYTVSGGSRPNWVDGLSGASDGADCVFRFRMATLCGVMTGPGDYPAAGAQAIIEARVTPTGSVTVSYPYHEVFADDSTPIYGAFVAGDLSAAIVTAREPMATLESADGIIRIDWLCAADRDDFLMGDSVAAQMSNPDLANCGIEVQSPHGTWTVKFSVLGAGIHGPIIGITDGAGGTRRVIMPATLSYTLWHPHTRFAMASDHEVGFMVSDQWDAYGVGGYSSPVRFAIVNIKTGAASLLGAVGFSELADVEHTVGPRLSVIQRKVVDSNGETVIEGVYLVSTKYSFPVRISRDSGATWSDYFTFPAAGGGAYYLGNPLMANMQPGAAIK